MRHFDLSPLYRSTVGFDQLFNMLDSFGGETSEQSYPPYNIERTGEYTYRVTMAVAGFGKDNIDIEARENVLTVKAGKPEEKADEKREMLYQGIAARAFERRFQLADHVQVTGANLENGLLHIELVRELPEAMKPRKISIGAATKQIDAKAA